MHTHLCIVWIVSASLMPTKGIYRCSLKDLTFNPLYLSIIVSPKDYEVFAWYSLSNIFFVIFYFWLFVSLLVNLVQIQGKYYFRIDPLGEGAKWRRSVGQEIYSPLLLAFSDQVILEKGDVWVYLFVNCLVTEYSFICRRGIAGRILI